MAHIKCRYSRPVCGQMWEPGLEYNECHYSFSEYNDPHPCDQYVAPKKRFGYYTCDHLRWEEVRFEKDAKSYELDAAYFTIGRRAIPRYDISFLEIDKEVIIKEEEQ